jgi:hypothetical protein
MCEWNYKSNGAPKEGRGADNTLYAVAAWVWFKVRPWTHGPECRWARIFAR